MPTIASTNWTVYWRTFGDNSCLCMDLEWSPHCPYTARAFAAIGDTRMTARDADMRRLAARILLVQAATTMMIAAVCVLVWGRMPALSALAGGAIGLIANAVMMLVVLRSTSGAAGALGRLMIGQMLKVMVTVALLVIVARGRWANWPALLFAYAATLFVYWFVPVLAHRTRRPRD